MDEMEEMVYSNEQMTFEGWLIYMRSELILQESKRDLDFLNDELILENVEIQESIQKKLKIEWANRRKIEEFCF